MSIKTILVCLNEVERVKVLLDLESAIAAKHDAHVTGLYVIPAVRVYAASDLQLTAQVFEGQREALLNRVSDVGADLLVMGAYGHSRLRELVLGGATRFVLQSMTVPVLMSH